jgi:hypothetical protein
MIDVDNMTLKFIVICLNTGKRNVVNFQDQPESNGMLQLANYVCSAARRIARNPSASLAEAKSGGLG